MDELSNLVLMLDKLIDEREEHFLHALSESSEQSLLAHLKNDIDFLKEKRTQLSLELSIPMNNE